MARKRKAGTLWTKISPEVRRQIMRLSARGYTHRQIASELGGKVKVAKLNIDENPELAAQFGVRSIPTLMMFKGGEVADIKVGAAPKTALSHWIGAAVA